ncbi:hypothetical protein T03_2054 [Trichinella britovi]|uniref:Uncharacterized protein n=1 Tax=Trichinella britovi TaxID=45882 RepID=A0A0V1CG62_TRIBR|nr:hypothetical protein T03_2054 [Trichinella britovi]
MVRMNRAPDGATHLGLRNFNSSDIKEGRRRGSLLTSMVIWIADENSHIIRFDRAAQWRLSSIYISWLQTHAAMNIREAVEVSRTQCRSE